MKTLAAITGSVFLMQAYAEVPGGSSSAPAQPQQRVVLGAILADIPPENANGRKPRGAAVGRILPDSVADKAGLKEYDIILKFGDRDVDEAMDIVNVVRAAAPGETVPIVILRALTTRLTLTAQF